MPWPWEAFVHEEALEYIHFSLLRGVKNSAVERIEEIHQNEGMEANSVKN
jgi:hypothetical protein